MYTILDFTSYNINPDIAGGAVADCRDGIIHVSLCRPLCVWMELPCHWCWTTACMHATLFLLFLVLLPLLSILTASLERRLLDTTTTTPSLPLPSSTASTPTPPRAPQRTNATSCNCPSYLCALTHTPRLPRLAGHLCVLFEPCTIITNAMASCVALLLCSSTLEKNCLRFEGADAMSNTKAVF
jgi:hypothetical protein